MVTPERISPGCPFKIIQRQVKISIVTPRNGVCLCAVNHGKNRGLKYLDTLPLFFNASSVFTAADGCVL